MRRLERWLHQHIFKVGWLLTKNLQTTTILYYLIFLPGVVLHELVYWLVAGILNVRADRAIAWPEAQAVAELRLTFVKLNKNASPLRIAIIGISPLIFGILFIGFIATNMLNVNGFVQAMGNGDLENLDDALRVLTSSTDFWLWVYLVFTVGNTMWPDVKELRGWRPVLIAVVVGVVLLYAAGLGDALIGRTLIAPALQGLNILAGTFAVIIAIDLVVTALLGGIESIVERITGDSATYQNGKLVAMRREEVLRARQQQRERDAKQATARSQRATGPPSIYSFPLPIPGAPGKESEPIVVSKEQQPVLPLGDTGRAGPTMITGTAAVVQPQPEPEEPFEDETTDEEEIPEDDTSEDIEEEDREDQEEVDERS